MNEEQSALWQQVFDNLFSKVSAVVGDLIAVGEWLTSNEGRQRIGPTNYYPFLLFFVGKGSYPFLYFTLTNGTHFTFRYSFTQLVYHSVYLSTAVNALPFLIRLIKYNKIGSYFNFSYS